MADKDGDTALSWRAAWEGAGGLVGRLSEARRYHNVVHVDPSFFSTRNIIKDRIWESLRWVALFSVYQRLRTLPLHEVRIVSTRGARTYAANQITGY